MSVSKGSGFKIGGSTIPNFTLSGGNLLTNGLAMIGGDSAGGKGTFTLNSGTWTNIGSFISIMYGSSATGSVLNVNGGFISAPTIQLGQNSGTSTLNLNGGIVQVDTINSTNSPASVLNFNGGALRANSTQGNFISLGGTAYKLNVLAGGAVIDTNGYNTTVTAPFLTGTTNDGGLTKTGAGTLTLSASSTYTGPTLISTGTLQLTGRLGNTAVTVAPGATLVLAGTTAIGGSITVATGATLVVTGTAAVGGSVVVANGATLDLTAGELSTGSLTLSGTSVLKMALGAVNDPANSLLQVNGSLVLDGSLIVYNRTGAVANQVSTVIRYSGPLTNNGLAPDAALSQWNVIVDTSTAGSVKFVLTQQYPLVEFTSADQTVTNSLQLDMAGKMHGYLTNALYYEARTPDGQLWDFGSMAPAAAWTIHLRHLRSGTNTVRVFSLDSNGIIESDIRSVVLQLGATPAVRPRPWPAELWWGGVATGQPPNYGYDQLVNPSNPWEFVKKYQDGIFLHGILPTASVLTQLAAAVAPSGGRFGREGSYYCNASLTFGATRASQALPEMDQLAGEGIYLTMTSNDWNPGLSPYPAAGIPVGWVAQFPTYTHQQLLDANMQQWSDYVHAIHAKQPGLKMGFTWSPVWFNWNGYPSLVLGRDSLECGDPFDYDMQEFFNEADATAAAEDGYFAFASDCPWSYILNWGDLDQELTNQQKILGYEEWLRSQGYFHTRICNHDGDDAAMQQNSYAVLTSQQAIGGRARTYLFESWYSGPVVWAPEADANSNPATSHAGSAMKAIKYLKGIKNLAGDLETLSLFSVSGSSNYVQIQLRNTGDVECLPAIAGIESGGSATLHYYDGAYNDITTAVLSAEGYVPPATLGAGQTLTLYVQATGSTGQNRSVSLEAFWNPQDPTGIVRSRLPLTLATGTAQSPYTAWATSYNLNNTPGQQAGFTDDPDGDGIPNGLEWLLGGNPLSCSAAILPRVTQSANNLVVTFARNAASESTATLTLEWGSDLIGWSPVSIGATSSGPDAHGVTVAIVPNGASLDTAIVTIPRAIAVSGRLFVRLKGTMP